MKLRLASIALIVAILGQFVLARLAPVAAAPTNPFAGIPISGTFPDASGGTGKFTGTADITRFASQNGKIQAFAMLKGTMTDASGKSVGNVNQQATLPLATPTGTCQVLHLVLGPLDLNLLGLMVHLNQVVLDITAQSGPGNLLGNLLCAIAGLLDNTSVLSNLLNSLLGLFGLAPAALQNPFLNIPVTGTFPSAVAGGAAPNANGTFAGVLDLTKFALQNGTLQALGTLKGTLVDAAGKSLGAVSQAVTLPLATPTGTCQVLHLVLGPLDLNLLGLMVHLNQVVLDITAQSGPGNLLGNLLCAIAGLLDNNSLLSNLLNSLLGLFRLMPATIQNPFLNIPIIGTFPSTVAGRMAPAATGTFAGVLDITNFAVQNGKLQAVGTLTGALVDTSGKSVGNVNQQVMLPLATPTGTCQVLHLVLGPLDLNLLGLMVHLNQVVLDITAQSGPGNLLGNLLCAIAGLLDNNSLLSNLLNQLLGIFGLAPTGTTNPFAAVPIAGTFTDASGGTGAFNGTAQLTSFALQNGKLVALGKLSGTMQDSTGKNLGTVTKAVTLPLATPTGTCQVLHLVLGPLDLNLLGLMVHLNQVVLDITAQSGPGNLLGNLLCAVAHLLDGNAPLSGLVALLNGILDTLNLSRGGATNPFLAIPIAGTFSNPNGGTGNFNGKADITSFAVQSGKLQALANLTGTMTDASGKNAGTVAQRVTLPLATPTGTCQVLHLVLGPLDLNLLGLNVHLNRVVLNITAHSGPGNLVGNLLCAIAGLLDNTNVLSNLLNSLLGLFGLAPAALQNPFLNIPVTGTFPSAVAGGAAPNATGTFAGVLNIASFAIQNGKLQALGALKGTLVDAAGKSLGAVSQAVTLPLATPTGTCQVLHLVLGPLDLNLLGLVVHLNQVVLDITAQSGPGNLLGNLLCAIAGLLDNNSLLSNLLNQLLGIFGLSPVAVESPFKGIPVTGTFPSTVTGGAVPSATGNFAGVLDITNFAVQNGKLQSLGTLAGSLTDAAGTNLGNVVQAVTLPLATPTGTCQVLHLVLGPLDLNLLGLVVHLNQVVLDITAQSGPGNLLGNLLCAIAGLLDNNGVLSNLLNQLLAIFGLAPTSTLQNPLKAVPLVGTFTDASGGTGAFNGTAQLTSFALQNGKLVALGKLSGTMQDSTGKNLGTVTKAVTLPLATPTGTCQVLHLVLGPLDLNLLGLMVHLNQVVLDITAQSGPGNLLGNLLCAVAHLLDGNAPLSGLVNLLNGILGALGQTPTATRNPLMAIPVTGTIPGVAGSSGSVQANGTFTGVLDITSFDVQNGALQAIGTLHGALVDATGKNVGDVTQAVTLPLATPTGTCQVLHLVLGPLDLNLLGLNVHLNQVVLDVSADAGSGNLVGNLLCAVADLLGGNGSAGSIAGVLNQLPDLYFTLVGAQEFTVFVPQVAN